jgi:integrase
MPRKRSEAPWLDRRSNGRFYVYWYDASIRRTRQLSLDTKDPIEAKARFGTFLLEGPGLYETGSEGLTVAVCLDQYLREHANQVADPVRQHNAAKHLSAFFRGVLVKDVDVPKCRAYVAARRAGEVGGGDRRKNRAGTNSTIRRELGVLAAAANHAVKWKRMTRAELPVIENPKVETQETAWFTTEELELLLMLAEGHLLRFIRLAYYTGARRRAVQDLTASQVDWNAGVIYLHEEGTVVTNKRKARVPLFKSIEDDIRWLIANGDGDSLFGGRDFYRPFRSLCESAGLADKSHPHILRHTRATHLLQKGKAPYDVAALLGDTVTTVLRTYGHHSPAHLKLAIGDD